MKHLFVCLIFFGMGYPMNGAMAEAHPQPFADLAENGQNFDDQGCTFFFLNVFFLKQLTARQQRLVLNRIEDGGLEFSQPHLEDLILPTSTALADYGSVRIVQNQDSLERLGFKISQPAIQSILDVILGDREFAPLRSELIYCVKK